MSRVPTAAQRLTQWKARAALRMLHKTEAIAEFEAIWYQINSLMPHF